MKKKKKVEKESGFQKFNEVCVGNISLSSSTEEMDYLKKSLFEVLREVNKLRTPNYIG